MFKKALFPLLFACIFFSACKQKANNIPTIGFLDFIEDATLQQAKAGFTDALKQNGYSEANNTLKIIYRNAQGNQPVLIQSCDYFIAENVDLIAANTTLSTITAVQKTKTIPVCMMVAPRPDLAKLTDAKGNAPANLFGTYEVLSYIDTSVGLIKTVLPNATRIGSIYNQAEPQSVDAFNRIKTQCAALDLELVSLPVNNSSETQLATESLLSKGIDAFFALPDNVIFSSFEVVAKSCSQAKVPVFTSEAGLVKRGAIAAFGADMYQWGFQSGLQAAEFLKNKSQGSLKPEMVKVRKRVFNQAVAKQYGITFDKTFSPLN